MILGFSTIPYWGFGARIFPYCEEQEGRFHLRIASFGPFEAIKNLRSIWRGDFHSPLLHDFLVDAVEIHCEKPAYLQVGGDVVGRRTLVLAKLSPRPIRVVDYYAPPPS